MILIFETNSPVLYTSIIGHSADFFGGALYNGEIAKAQWVDAQHLQKGYRLLAESGEWQIVTATKPKRKTTVRAWVCL
ncbi:TPA: hypothetical protein PWU90_002104 [Mannheimia haemolytica]|uniref:hypothetical protein n=1 Tax=Mannheimia haemolytica TaxID=75985 RepID=UPI000B2FD513|nr:hypothetical protein [Mannheimia haemolytica]HDL1113868.1 hypothetical protein [Mannheimia haemolytica]HDL1116320.1 hypothetical protein [Mannheimia haemolytica]HDL1124453.1 hypothetical protein [Mannheimia haemolytica]HDL1127056.1 hypothetical protein [Mannheimia haemolytica]HDL1129493.1 hypothetical protein [Mannheimia haemolytica]